MYFGDSGELVGRATRATGEQKNLVCFSTHTDLLLPYTKSHRPKPYLGTRISCKPGGGLFWTRPVCNSSELPINHTEHPSNCTATPTWF